MILCVPLCLLLPSGDLDAVFFSICHHFSSIGVQLFRPLKRALCQ